MYFHYVAIWKKQLALHLNMQTPKMFSTKYGWNWLSGSQDLTSHLLFNVFSIFRFYLQMEKDMTLHLIPFTKRTFCAKFGWNCHCGSWEKKRCLMLSVYFHPVANIYMYFGKVIKQSWISFTFGYFVWSLVEIESLKGQGDLKKKAMHKQIDISNCSLDFNIQQFDGTNCSLS